MTFNPENIFILYVVGSFLDLSILKVVNTENIYIHFVSALFYFSLLKEWIIEKITNSKSRRDMKTIVKTVIKSKCCSTRLGWMTLIIWKGGYFM